MQPFREGSRAAALKEEASRVEQKQPSGRYALHPEGVQNPQPLYSANHLEIERLITEFKKGNAQIPDLATHYDKMKNYYLEMNYVLTSYDRQFYKEAL